MEGMQRSIIQKKFKGDSKGKQWGSGYMEQSTLLEPTLEKGDTQWEEQAEISQSLGKLKKKFDVVKKQAVKMETDLDLVKKEIKQIEGQETQAEQTYYESSTRVEQLEESKKTTASRLEEENMQTTVYGHMVSRMNKDLIAQEIMKKEMENSLRNKEMIYSEENDASRKWKEEQL